RVPVGFVVAGGDRAAVVVGSGDGATLRRVAFVGGRLTVETSEGAAAMPWRQGLEDVDTERLALAVAIGSTVSGDAHAELYPRSRRIPHSVVARAKLVLGAVGVVATGRVT